VSYIILFCCFGGFVWGQYPLSQFFWLNVPVVGTRLKEPGVGNLDVMQYVPLVIPDWYGTLYGNMVVRHFVD
jgi:hypothetical protein